MNNVTYDREVNDTLINIIKSIGGKKIKKFAFTCRGINGDYNNAYEEENVILLKKANRLVFTTYNLMNRSTVFSTDDSNIKELHFRTIDSNNYEITLFDGLYWNIRVTL